MGGGFSCQASLVLFFFFLNNVDVEVLAFFGEYLVLIGPKAETFSSADRQVQAGRFHF